MSDDGSVSMGEGVGDETQNGIPRLMPAGFIEYLQEQTRNIGEREAQRRAGGCERERDGARCGAAIYDPPRDQFYRRDSIEEEEQKPRAFGFLDSPSLPAKLRTDRWWRQKHLCAKCYGDALGEVDALLRAKMRAYFDARIEEQLPYMFRWAKPRSPEVDKRIPASVRRKAGEVLKLMLTKEPEVATMTLFGDPGAGKTSLAVLLVRHIRDLALAAPLDSDVVRIACGLRFISSWDLVHGGVGKNSNEPEEAFQKALDAPMVVLDDVGAERDGKTILYGEYVTELISRRFHRGSRPPLPTIVTTGLDDEAAIKLYGGGVARRFLTDDGGLVRVIRFDRKAK